MQAGRPLLIMGMGTPMLANGLNEITLKAQMRAVILFRFDMDPDTSYHHVCNNVFTRPFDKYILQQFIEV